MARPKQRVDEKNKDDIYQYFNVFFSENRYIYRNTKNRRSGKTNYFFKDGKGNLTELPFKSLESFKLLDSYRTDVTKLQQWIDDYISEHLWKMCLNSLYQKRFTYHNKMLYTVKITSSARQRLNLCKEETDMTIEEMLDRAIELLYSELINKE